MHDFDMCCVISDSAFVVDRISTEILAEFLLEFNFSLRPLGSLAMNVFLNTYMLLPLNIANGCCISFRISIQCNVFDLLFSGMIRRVVQCSGE